MMGSRPDFRAWLLEQRHRDDPTGDVARDLWYDITTGCMASTEVSVNQVQVHLERHGAIEDAMQALLGASREYMGARHSPYPDYEGVARGLKRPCSGNLLPGTQWRCGA